MVVFAGKNIMRKMGALRGRGVVGIFLIRRGDLQNYNFIFYIFFQNTKQKIGIILDDKTSLDSHHSANVVQGYLRLIKDFPVKKIYYSYFFTLKNLYWIMLPKMLPYHHNTKTDLKLTFL